MVGRIIEGPDCVAEGADWLAARVPAFGAALARQPADGEDHRHLGTKDRLGCDKDGDVAFGDLV